MFKKRFLSKKYFRYIISILKLKISITKKNLQKLFNYLYTYYYSYI